MKKGTRIVALLLTLAMVVGLTACNNATSSSAAASSAASAAAATDSKPADTKVTDKDKHLVIYVWNTEFKDMFEKYYLKDHPLPDGYSYEFVTNPNQNGVYQNKLDEALLSQDSAEDAKKIDIFLIEADYALKYVNSDATKDIKSLGITDADLANQYDYTKKIATSSKGVLKGVSWQATPGLFVYRRSAAKDIFGTDDPTKVQDLLSTWAKFDEAAKTVKEKTNGTWTMLSGFDDSYRAFTNTATKPWVDANDKIQLDDTVNQWIDQTKSYTDNGYNQKTSLWDDNWTKGQTSAGKVFGYFYSTWGINFTLLGNSLDKKEADGGKQEKGNGIFGDWAACQGPQSYYWGGTWICASSKGNTDALVADVMKYFTVDTASMEKYSKASMDYVNNKAAIKNITSAGYKCDFLGGQDHISLFAAAAEKIKLDNLTPYDQPCNESIQTAMHDYFNGKVSKDDAMKNFYDLLLKRCPNLKK